MDIQNIRNQAKKEHLKGNTSEAIILLTSVIKQDATRIDIALDMVQIFLDIGELTQARQLFEKLPQQVQTSSDGVSIVSQLNFKPIANNTSGIKNLQAEIFKNPDNFKARLDLSACFFANFEIDNGMEELFFIQQHNPQFQNYAAKELIVAVCKMLENGDMEASKKHRTRLSQMINA